jgi:hypothetical protein
MPRLKHLGDALNAREPAVEVKFVFSRVLFSLFSRMDRCPTPFLPSLRRNRDKVSSLNVGTYGCIETRVSTASSEYFSTRF